LKSCVSSLDVAMDEHNSPARITLIDLYFIMPVMTYYLGWKCAQ